MESLGRYELIRRIAVGGMAEVWEGVIATGSFRRRVAIKRMFRDSAAPASFERMFLDEARIASQLHHANIVSILDFGVFEGAPYQVLEYVDGLDAEQLWALGEQESHSLPVALALHLSAEIGHALHYAHEARGEDGQLLGIVHRDVSPQNVLVSWEGDVKLSDFGIALAQGRIEKTRTGMIKGKLSYMSPEQATGGQIDRRTDVFALGCLLHMLIAGKSPLAGENRMTDLLTGVDLPISPSVPDDVKEIIQQALRRSKHDRFENASAMALACGKALAPRIDVDSRTALRSWVEQLRERTQVARQASDDRTAPNSLEASTRPARPGPGQPLDDALAPTVRRVVAGNTVVEGKPRSRRTVAVVAGGSLLGAALVAGSWATGWLPRALNGAPAPAGTAAAAVSHQVVPSAPAAATPGAPLPAVVAVVPATLASETRADEAPGEPASAKKLDLATGEAPAPRASPPVAARSGEGESAPSRAAGHRPGGRPKDTSPTEAGEGFLAIGGEAALNSAIFVDGKPEGYAPKTVGLSVGDHLVRLVPKEGPASQKRVTVTPRDTQISPQRWTVPEE